MEANLSKFSNTSHLFIPFLPRVLPLKKVWPETKEAVGRQNIPATVTQHDAFTGRMGLTRRDRKSHPKGKPGFL